MIDNKLTEGLEDISETMDELGNRSSVFAKWVLSKMRDIGITELFVGSRKLMVVNITSSGGGDCDCLGFEIGDYYNNSEIGGDLTVDTISSNGYFYYQGDFNCRINYPNLDEVTLLCDIAVDVTEELKSKLKKAKEMTFPDIGDTE